jgi:hypothetical protein
MTGITRLIDCFIGNRVFDENQGFCMIFCFQKPVPELLKYWESKAKNILLW